MRGIFRHKFFFVFVDQNMQHTCMCTAACRQLAADASAACTHTHWWCHQGVIKYYPRGMCSNSNVWLETRTQASPAIRGHARTSNHHPSKKYLTTTTIRTVLPTLKPVCRMIYDRIYDIAVCHTRISYIRPFIRCSQQRNLYIVYTTVCEREAWELEGEQSWQRSCLLDLRNRKNDCFQYIR